MEEQQTTIRELIIPLERYPQVNEEQSVEEAVREVMAFHRDPAQLTPHALVLVVNAHNQLVGRLSLMDILRGFAPRLFASVQVEQFDGKEGEFPGLAAFHEESLYAEWTRNRQKSIRPLVRPLDLTLEADSHILKALVMMSGHHAYHVPVTEGGQVIGVLRLEEIFMVTCNSYCRVADKSGGMEDEE
ncbi:CBS domain-containing protein [Desulfogranum mediterraneum]|uniref:CBS domain-containing protein n=1 Tax=Desulfogranum mediterraneum TaxID=160661 RepID=UPI0004113075|nr:CBS domain-containing protein [Desulfogranum mediterraneum]